MNKKYIQEYKLYLLDFLKGDIEEIIDSEILEYEEFANMVEKCGEQWYNNAR